MADDAVGLDKDVPIHSMYQIRWKRWIFGGLQQLRISCNCFVGRRFASVGLKRRLFQYVWFQRG